MGRKRSRRSEPLIPDGVLNEYRVLSEYSYFYELPSLRTGTFRGVLIAEKLLTMPDQRASYDDLVHMPTLLLLVLGDKIAPLKWLDSERADVLANTPVNEAWPIAADPLLVEADAARLGAQVGAEVTLEGVAYPVYCRGCYAILHIWGLYVRPI